MTSIRFSGSTHSAPLLAVAAAMALLGTAPAQADSSGNTATTDSGSISATIEKFGQSLCPSLVKPGSSLATTLSELQGNTGLTPTLTGMVAGFVIQTQCPSVMTKLANGELSALQLLPGQDQPPAGLDLAALLDTPKKETAPTPTGLDLSALLNSPKTETAPTPSPKGLDLSALINPPSNQPAR